MVSPAAQLRLWIDGQPVTVASGLSVAAALWNAGQWRCRTSVSGEPRGPLCAMGTCFECRVRIDGVPGRRACLELCRAEMTVETSG
jgi:hypothetical protein